MVASWRHYGFFLVLVVSQWSCRPSVKSVPRDDSVESNDDPRGESVDDELRNRA